MITHNHIISLVRSLTPSEKGYLKKLFAVHHENDLKQNFELLEKEITESSRSAQVDENFDFTKLFEFVLNSLEGYHKSTAKEVRSILNQIEILVDKNLYQQVEKQVVRVKSLAEKNNVCQQYVEILEWELAMLAIKAPTLENEKKFETIFELIDETINKQKDLH